MDGVNGMVDFVVGCDDGAFCGVYFKEIVKVVSIVSVLFGTFLTKNNYSFLEPNVRVYT